MQEEFLVFIEVKTYKVDSLVDPREMITRSKQQKILKTARYFLMKNPSLKDYQFRFDLIIVEKNQVKEHLENIFLI